MREGASRPEQGILTQKVASSLDSGEVTIGNLPASVDGIPLDLLFDIRNEIARLMDTHGAVEPVRTRTRSRMAVKSLLVRGVLGLSADSNNQASSSGVILRDVR